MKTELKQTSQSRLEARDGTLCIVVETAESTRRNRAWPDRHPPTDSLFPSSTNNPSSGSMLRTGRRPSALGRRQAPRRGTTAVWRASRP